MIYRKLALRKYRDIRTGLRNRIVEWAMMYEQQLSNMYSYVGGFGFPSLSLCLFLSVYNQNHMIQYQN
jgi:hypothetical protein